MDTTQSLGANEVLEIVNDAIYKECGRHLTDLESEIFKHSWNNRRYEEIAELEGYSHDHIRAVGSQLWKALSLVLKESVNRRNFKQAVNRRLTAIKREILADSEQDRFALRFSNISKIDAVTADVLEDVFRIAYRELDEFNVEDTIKCLHRVNPSGIYCWEKIKDPGKVIAFFILAPINKKTCTKIIEKEIRGAKQLNEDSFTKKWKNASGIYIVNVLSTDKKYNGCLMKSLKEEVLTLLNKSLSTKYIFTRPISSYIASLVMKYGFNRITDSPSPIYFVNRNKIRLNNKIIYPYESPD